MNTEPELIFLERDDFTFIDLFSGIGGIRMAFEQSGMKCLASIDFDEKCKITQDLNFDGVKTQVLDINNLDPKSLPKADIVCMGFNCQPFSVAGKRLGFEDERTNSFLKSIEILKVVKPKCVFIENVKGILSHNKGKSFEKVKELICYAGFSNFNYQLVNSSVHLPQNRERVYIVAFNDCLQDFDFDTHLNKFQGKIELKHCLERDVSEKYFYTKKDKIYPILKENCKNEDSIYQYRRYYVRENKSKLCPCLTSNMGTGGHNVPIIKIGNKIRKLTPRECFNLQGFPSSYKFPHVADCHLYKQIGNSVSVPIVGAIADGIYEFLTPKVKKTRSR